MNIVTLSSCGVVVVVGDVHTDEGSRDFKGVNGREYSRKTKTSKNEELEGLDNR